MAKRTGARPSGARRGDARHIPEQGELIWLSFTPQAGREQVGRAPGWCCRRAPTTPNRVTTSSRRNVSFRRARGDDLNPHPSIDCFGRSLLTTNHPPGSPSSCYFRAAL